MTEKKRFILFEDLDIKDKATGKIYPPCLDKGLTELIDLLNTFNDENEQLKKILCFLKDDNAEDILDVLNFQENKIWELKQKNEQLKQIIYDNESVIIREWSSHIREDITKLDEAYKSEDINDLIRFCKRS